MIHRPSGEYGGTMTTRAIARPFVIDHDQGVTVISFIESVPALHGETVEEITPMLIDIASEPVPRILLDMKSVEFFNSSFIELLFRLWNRLKNKPGSQFALCNLHPFCKDVLDVTNLTTVWKSYNTREEALAAFTGP